MSSGIYTVDELAMARSKEDLKVAIEKTILNGDTVNDDDCSVDYVASADRKAINELLSRLDRTNQSYGKYLAVIDESVANTASDMADKFKLVF